MWRAGRRSVPRELEARPGRKKPLFRLRLRRGKALIDAMLFGHADPLPGDIRATYRLSANHYNGSVTLQLILEHWQPQDT